MGIIHLNCNELQDLRLVIEWVPIPTTSGVPTDLQTLTEQQQRDADMAFNEILTGISAVKTTELNILRDLVIIQPTLLLDEIVDEPSLKKIKNVPITYINLDSEIVNLKPITGTATSQIIQQRLRGFNDKNVRRLLMIQKFHTRQKHKMLSQYQSPAMTNEQIQFTLNGSKMLPYKGITTEAEKLSMCNDVWGIRCQPQGAHVPNLTYSQKLFANFDAGRETTDQAVEGCSLMSALSYGGFNINNRVEELILEYSRDKRQIDTTKLKNKIIGITTTVQDPDGIANKAKVELEQAVDISSGTPITVAGIGGTGWSNLVGNYPMVTGFRGGTTAGERDEANTYRPIYTSKIILNKDVHTYNAGDLDLTNATIEPQTPGDTTNVSILNSKAAIDLLFWGECIKTMSVNNNKVQISY